MERHKPVLLQESINSLSIQPNSTILDATIGTGGHTREIIAAMRSGTVVALDTDATALAEAKEHLNSVQDSITVHFVEENFRNIRKVSHALDIQSYDAVLADLGWGSHQLASGRGLSFMRDEVLNMCYSVHKDGCPVTALDVVNTFREPELVGILREYGEERWAVRIVKHIIDARKQNVITTTKQLEDIVSGAIPRKLHPKNTHAATKTFQAIRIVVNDEISALKEFMDSIKDLMRAEARITIISFHSLEDRIVKHTFREWERNGLGKRITKKAVRPSLKECADNPRARSAKLRTFTFTTI